ncbi:hypothetical protein [Streptomyces sp. NPDC049916]|uniref:hypothetical protein n=1 Tax=Streptomyces sp. NPDC049916 TaxID=3155156 RepID=UPI00342574E6
MGDRQQKTRGVTTGPLVAVLIALVCMAVGQATGVLTLKGTGVDPSSPTGVIVSCLAAFLPTAVLLGAWVALGERRPVASLGLSGAGRTRGILIGGASAVAGLIVLNTGASVLSGSAEGDVHPKTATGGKRAR